jgi:hypothetical protein
MCFRIPDSFSTALKRLKKVFFRKGVAGVFYLWIFGCYVALEQLYWLDNHIRDAVE